MPSLCGACGDESYSGTVDGNPIDSRGHVPILEVRDVHVQDFSNPEVRKYDAGKLGRYSGSTFKAEICLHVPAVHWVA